MLFNSAVNNSRNDKLVEMTINNVFRKYGYRLLYLPQLETGEDRMLNEVRNKTFNNWFMFTGVVEEFDMKSSDLFNKFGIEIPDRITIWFKRKDALAIIDELGLRNSSGGLEGNGIPQEGDIMIFPLQDKSISYNRTGVLGDLINSGPLAAKFLYQVTEVDQRRTVFNGNIYYYRLLCKVYEKSVADLFTGDVSVINGAINNAPETDPRNQKEYESFKDAFTDTTQSPDGKTDTTKYD